MSYEKRKKLIEILDEAEVSHAKLRDQAKKIAEDAQKARDHARITKVIAESQSPLSDQEVQRLESSWQQQNDAARSWTGELGESRGVYGPVFQSTILTSTNTATGTVVGAMYDLNQSPAIQQTVAFYSALERRQESTEQLREAIVRCGLDSRQGDRRSVLEFLNEAEDAITSGTSPIAVLIPLREAINAAIESLLRRSRGQEPASTWKEKVLSIGRRCGKANLPSGYFDRLADAANSQINELSGIKPRGISRVFVLVFFNDGLQFLLTLLDGVDETRLRSA